MTHLTLRPDNKIYDIDKEFPQDLKKVALAMSGGIESTALLLLLIQQYGVENVSAFSAQIEGRRFWESVHAAKLASLSGVKQFYRISDQFRVMKVDENLLLRQKALEKAQFDGWFHGCNKLLFSNSFLASEEQKNFAKENRIYTPFTSLYKHHTIDIFFKLGKEDILYKTFSCTTRGDFHCGKCYCCHERVTGFDALGEKDKATYLVEWDVMLEDAKMALEKRKKSS